MENFSFNNFDIQFGEDASSDLNRILSEALVSFNLSYIEFQIGVIDKKLQPFDALNKLIRVKRINMYLKVRDKEQDDVATFKIEGCKFLKVVNHIHFLNGFTRDTNLKGEYYSNRLRVEIEIESIFSNDIELYKKDYKAMKDLDAMEVASKKPSLKMSAGLGIYVDEIKIDAGDNGIRYRGDKYGNDVEKEYAKVAALENEYALNAMNDGEVFAGEARDPGIPFFGTMLKG